MSFFSRLENGWELTKISLDTINKNRSLLLFPVFSVVSLLLILATFGGGSFYLFGDEIQAFMQSENESAERLWAIGAIFLFYLVNFFVVVYFNSALIYCAVKVLNGNETSLSEGIDFANSRIGKIFGWALLSATVGTLLQILQNTGKLGKFVSALLGAGWSIMTFFVVPVLIFEDKSVIDTVKESGRLMRQKWGESLTANMSFGIFYILGIIAGIGIFFLLIPVAPVMGVLLSILTILLVSTITATAQTVFVAAVYNHVTGAPTGNFDSDTLDGVFINK